MKEMYELEILWDFDQIKGCSLVGYIECTKHELEDKFGKNGLAINREEGGYDDPKVQNEWWVRINETKLTIYDYKEDRPIADDDKIIWHIGSDQGIQALFELMVVGFEPAQVLTREEFYNKRFGNFV
jgi:hypothetical protein